MDKEILLKNFLDGRTLVDEQGARWSGAFIHTEEIFRYHPLNL